MMQKGCVGKLKSDDGTITTFLVSDVDDEGYLNGMVFLEEKDGVVVTDKEPFAIANINPVEVDDVTADYLIKDQYSSLSWKPWKSIEVDINCIVGRGTEKNMKETLKETYNECTEMMKLSYDLSKPIAENVIIGRNVYSNKLLLQIAEEIYCGRILKMTEKLVPFKTGKYKYIHLNIRYCGEKVWEPILIDGMGCLYALAARAASSDEE